MARTLIEVYLHIVFSTKHQSNIVAKLASRCFAVNGIENHVHTLVSLGKTMAINTTYVLFGKDNATAPRSVRGGRRFRGSHEGSLHSPPRDPRLFHRPLRGRAPAGLSPHPMRYRARY